MSTTAAHNATTFEQKHAHLQRESGQGKERVAMREQAVELTFAQARQIAAGRHTERCHEASKRRLQTTILLLPRICSEQSHAQNQ